MVLIDDFRREDVRHCGGLAYLLRITDRGNCSVEVKGGSAMLRATTIIITCP